MKVYVKAGYLFDGQVVEQKKDVVIAIEGEKIVEVGTGLTIPQGAEIVDWSDKYVLPGLIDCHVHTSMNGNPSNQLASLKQLVPYKAMKALTHAQADLQAGFTTLRDVGGSDYGDIAVRNAINEGLFEGPRMQVAGRCITITGGHADSHYSPEVEYESGHRVDSPEEARKAARTNLKYGADLIKVMATGGVLSDGNEAGVPQLTYEEMKAALDEVNKLGLGSAAHAQGRVGIKEATRAGVRSIEHGCILDDEAIELMLKHGTYLVPTLCAPYFILQYGEEAGIPPYAIRKTKYIAVDHVANAKKAYDAGVPIAMGTDAGTPFNYHGKNAKELELLVEAGLPVEAALFATGKVAAKLMGWEGKVGGVGEGYFADLVAVDADPMKDIKVLQDVKHVIKGGKVIR